MDWYEEDVKGVIDHRNSLRYEPEAIFYGSSTIRLWDNLYDDFKKYKPAKLGFGGSTLAACTWFFDRIVTPLKQPQKFILYAGDNDLGDGRHPEEVCIFFRQFMVKLREHYKEVPLYFISVKPSESREDIMDKVIQTNNLIKGEIHNSENAFYIDIFSKMISKKGKPIKSYFDSDGLHLSKKGYEVLKETILEQCFKNGNKL